MASDCHHHEHHVHHGLKGAALGQALGAAEDRCTTSQERLTAPRRRVLELLLSADAPLKAYDLIAAFGQHGEPAKPPTVYRALEFLERLGFAHRIESLNAYVPCRIEGGHMAAFLICDCCGEAAEFQPDLSAARDAASRTGYAVRAITLEARGLCAACQAG
ncbi:MAG: transcriptional repressor [Phenylobacterium sp.]|uniref:Fur family transcriptional regulator n=1 Tax=Phenylobacterium sp. TaxID=1871053 RepID=UPI001223A884|nr:Fur family transcriptional regulator [Phenylobacterium sp.]TAL31894.1 MAG: transcriptional repressor [Phenylobacterium sp.]